MLREKRGWCILRADSVLSHFTDVTQSSELLRGSSNNPNYLFIYYWRITGLQNFVVFCQTSTWISHQFSSVAQSCQTLCNPMNSSMPGLPVRHQLPEFIQTHVHQVGDAIQPSHPLSSPSPPAPNPSQHQDPFQWLSSSHEMAKVLEFQLQP